MTSDPTSGTINATWRLFLSLFLSLSLSLFLFFLVKWISIDSTPMRGVYGGWLSQRWIDDGRLTDGLCFPHEPRQGVLLVHFGEQRRHLVTTLAVIVIDVIHLRHTGAVRENESDSERRERERERERKEWWQLSLRPWSACRPRSTCAGWARTSGSRKSKSCAPWSCARSWPAPPWPGSRCGCRSDRRDRSQALLPYNRPNQSTGYQRIHRVSRQPSQNPE